MSGFLGRGRQPRAPSTALPESKKLPEPPPEETEALSFIKAVPADGGKAEEEFLDRGLPIRDLEREGIEDEFGRSKKFKDHFEFLAVRGLDALFITFLVLGIVWLLHLILPEKCDHSYVCRWLSPDEVTIIQDILTGG